MMRSARYVIAPILPPEVVVTKFCVEVDFRTVGGPGSAVVQWLRNPLWDSIVGVDRSVPGITSAADRRAASARPGPGPAAGPGGPRRGGGLVPSARRPRAPPRES